MEIRAYTARDEKSAIDLWNAALEQDQIDRGNFYKRVVCDVNFDPGNYLLAEEDGEPAGFAYCTKRRVHDEIAGLEPDRGWIVAMGVHPRFRRRGIGRRLVEAAEKMMAGQGAVKLDIGTYSNNYFCPGVDKKAYEGGVKFFEKLGYENRGECCSMDICLHDFVYPAKYAERKRRLEEQGYTIRSFEASDAVGLFKFVGEDFPHWLPNVRDCALSGKAEERMFVAKDPDGNPVGFAMRAMDGTEERFGPFGTKPSLQGMGIGSILFNDMMLSMNRRRIFYTYFLWTGGRNLDIYGTWGMKIYRTYCLMGTGLGPAANTGQAAGE